jgi:hypothetical protein
VTLLILYHAKIHTQNPDRAKVTALAIHGNKILAVGSDSEILEQFGSKAQRIDLNGGYILPGLTDSHLHLIYLSQSLNSVNCETPTLQACLERVADRARYINDDSWIEGHGWNHNVWENGTYGTAAQLDAISGDHPVILHAKSLHAAWVNSTALKLAGINSNTPDPEGGEIMRNSSGEPTGILLESAIGLVAEKIPVAEPAALAKDLLKVQSYLWQMGLTGIHDFDGPEAFQALQILQQEGNLHLRVYKNLPAWTLSHLIEVGLRSGFGNPMLRLGSLKLFSDGALGPQSAAMLDPYEGSTSCGKLLLTRQKIVETGIKAVENGWSLTVHAIGDLANRVVLDGLTGIRKYEDEHGLPHLPHRIEHVQLINKSDQSRLAKLNIIASMQPIHCTSDMLVADKYWGNRADQAYAFRSLIDHGTQVVFGSDAPVESPNPFHGLHAAVTRRKQDGSPHERGWHPEQRITLAEALTAYTTAPAHLAGLGHCLGRIAPDHFADLIVLQQDPFLCSQQDLYTLLPEMTMVDGYIVYRR